MSTGLSRRKGPKRVEVNEDNEDLNESFVNNEPVKKIETVMPVLTLLEEVVLIGLKDKEGYLSFWNDNISYALRGLIIIELALRGKIRMVMDPNRKRFELPDRLIEVVDSSLTGETLLDEALKHMKSDSENLSVANWIDYLSGETWNLMKVSYHLKQVRERLAKGLVDKGVLKTEMKSFLLFDMATHPINDPKAKKLIIKRILNLLTARNVIIENDDVYFPPNVDWMYLRSLILVCACNAANVLENVLVELNFEQRDKAFIRAEELATQYSDYPFINSPATNGTGLGTNLFSAIQLEIDSHESSTTGPALEVVAAVMSIFSRMDAIL